MINKRKAHMIMIRKNKPVKIMNEYLKTGAVIAENRHLYLRPVAIYEDCYLCIADQIDHYIKFDKKYFDKHNKNLK